MKPKINRNFISLTLITLVTSAPLHAANQSWQINNDGLWFDTTNWAADAAPGSTSTLDSTDIATFGINLTASRFVAVDANRNIGGITFSNTSAFGYSLLSGNLRLSNGGIIQSIGNTGAHTDTISSPIEIQGDGGTASFTNTSTLATRLMNIGALSGASTGANVTTITLGGANTGSNALSGIIENGAGGGTLALIKSDAGLWSLQNTGNTYSGGTTLNAGTLQALTAGSMGAGQVTLTGGQLHLINNANTAYNNNASVTGSTTIAATKVSGQSGNIAHTLGTLNIGASTLTVSKFFNTTSGTLTFGATTLTGNAAFATSASTNLILGTVGGDFSITKGTTNATGTLILAANNTFTGGTNINVGTLQAGNNGSTGDLGTGPVSIATGASLSFSRNGSATFDNAISGAGSVRLANANSIIDLTNASNTGTTAIQNGTLHTNNTSSNITLGTTNSTFNYGILGLKSNFTAALGTAPGNVSWATGVNVSGGFAVMDATTRSVNIGGNLSPDTLTVGSTGFAGGTLASNSNNSRIALGDINGFGLGTVDFQNPINLGTGDRSLIFIVNGAAQSPGILSGAITGIGTSAGTGDSLVKFGNGNLTLSGTNTYTGRTVAGGQAALILGSANAFSPNTWMHLNGGLAGTLGGILGLGHADLNANLGQTAGNIHFPNSGGFAAFGADRSVTLNNGATLAWGSTTSFVPDGQNLILGQAKADRMITLTNPIDLNAAERNIHVNDGLANIDASLSGEISNGALKKSGSGVLALSGANTYLGDTRVNAGALWVNGTLGDTYVTVDANGTLGGNGTITGAAYVNGSIAPGPSTDSLQIGFLGLAETSKFNYEMNSSLSTGDLLHSTTDLDILAGAELIVTDAATASVPLGTKLTLISYVGLWNNGTFNYLGTTLANESLFSLGENTWQIKYDNTTGGSNFTEDQTGATAYVTLTAVDDVVVNPYDSWAQGFGIDPQGLKGGPNDDFDGDGTSNLAEFRLGLTPNDGRSRFASSLTQNSADGSITLTWPSQPGLSFAISSSTTLSAFDTAEASVPAAAAPATTTTWTSGPQSNPKKFFRVAFTPAP